MVDTDRCGLILEPQPAEVQDRDGTCVVLRLSRRSFPFIVKAFADSGYAGEAPTQATSITIEIVKKPPDQADFAVHSRRWVVERFFAWTSCNRWLWKDPQVTPTPARVPPFMPLPSCSSSAAWDDTHGYGTDFNPANLNTLITKSRRMLESTVSRKIKIRLICGLCCPALVDLMQLETTALNMSIHIRRYIVIYGDRVHASRRQHMVEMGLGTTDVAGMPRPGMHDPLQFRRRDLRLGAVHSERLGRAGVQQALGISYPSVRQKQPQGDRDRHLALVER
jgi:transposase